MKFEPMNRRELSEKLAVGDPRERMRLLSKHPDLCDAALASALQEFCYKAWTSEPRKVSGAVAALRDLRGLSDDSEVAGHFHWASAIEHLVDSKLIEALASIDESEAAFLRSGNRHAAANTQISKLYALALLGRYGEAIDCGIRARAELIAANDLFSAAKVEHNIGNLYLRRDLYAESEPFLRAAFRRFEKLGDQAQAAMLENNLAFAKAAQNEFAEAERIYRRGLRRARKHGLTAIEADIEASVSKLQLFQGNYDRAFSHLEKARGIYESLGMATHAVTTELEIADLYLELNLIPEAIGLYKQTEKRFAALGMQAELARNLRNHARALLATGEEDSAGPMLAESERLFMAEGNPIAAAELKLTRAFGLFQQADLDAAWSEATKAGRTFRSGNSRRNEILADLLRGEIAAAKGDLSTADAILRSSHENARGNSLQAEFMSLATLGRINRDEKLLEDAIAMAEESRAALASEEFRISFLKDKLEPYDELVKLRLAAGDVEGAFRWHERSRSKTLLESIGTNDGTANGDPRLIELRAELNWYYSRLNRDDEAAMSDNHARELRKQARVLEAEFAELSRRRGSGTRAGVARGVRVPETVRELLGDATLIEYTVLDGQLGAFVIGRSSIEFVASLANERWVADEVQRLLLQAKTARLEGHLSTTSLEASAARLRRHSHRLYEALLRPFEPVIGNGPVIVAPAGSLHYLPFQSLHDGTRYVVDKWAVSVTPSAGVLLNTNGGALAAPQSIVLAGVTSKTTPLVADEISEIAGMFPSAVKLVDKKASVGNLERHLDACQVVHLACHGTFRPDNPSFSALALHGGNLTVRDVGRLRLDGKMVVLSACETGLNRVVSGEELIGLTQGFLSAGATTLLMSLWNVNDRSTKELMKTFYCEILKGRSASESLQIAQTCLLKQHPHPYFWSPFVVVGR